MKQYGYACTDFQTLTRIFNIKYTRSDVRLNKPRYIF